MMMMMMMMMMMVAQSRSEWALSTMKKKRGKKKARRGQRPKYGSENRGVVVERRYFWEGKKPEGEVNIVLRGLSMKRV